jgi:hypothetical protein
MIFEDFSDRESGNDSENYDKDDDVSEITSIQSESSYVDNGNLIHEQEGG